MKKIVKKIVKLFDKAIVRLARAMAPVDQAPHELGMLNLGEKDYAEPPEKKSLPDLWRADHNKIGPPS